jgi:hypothetical protein
MTVPKKVTRKTAQTLPPRGQKGGGSTVAAASQQAKATQQKVGSPSGPAGGMVEVKILPLAPTVHAAAHLDRIEGAKPSCQKCYGTGRLGWQIAPNGSKSVVPCVCVIRASKRLAAARHAAQQFIGESKRSERQAALLAPALTVGPTPLVSSLASPQIPNSLPVQNPAPVADVEKRAQFAQVPDSDGENQKQSRAKG